MHHSLVALEALGAWPVGPSCPLVLRRAGLAGRFGAGLGQWPGPPAQIGTRRAYAAFVRALLDAGPPCSLAAWEGRVATARPPYVRNRAAPSQLRSCSPIPEAMP